MDYGMKISQDGYDVKTADDKNLILTSKFNSLKIAQEASTTLLVASGATTTKTIPHSLGYAPSHLVLVKSFAYGGTSYWITDGSLGQVPIVDPNGNNTNTSSPSDDSFFYAYSDSSNLYVDIFNGSGGSKTYSIYYFIFIEDNAWLRN